MCPMENYCDSVDSADHNGTRPVPPKKIGRCQQCVNKEATIKKLEAVAGRAAALFQKGGYFEYYIGSSHHKELQEALKKVGLL